MCAQPGSPLADERETQIYQEIGLDTSRHGARWLLASGMALFIETHDHLMQLMSVLKYANFKYKEA